MQGKAVTVAGHRDIGTVAVHARRRQHMRAVHGHALRLVDRGGIAMIDVRIILGVESDIAAIVGAHGHALRRHLLDGAECAVLDAQAPLVAQEHDAVAAGELALAALGADCTTHRCPARHWRAAFRARVIEFAHLVIGVGEDDPRIAGAGLPVAIPALDQLAACGFPRLGNVHHAAFAIGLNGKTGAPGSKVPRGVLLPAFMLAAHLADFDAAVPFVDRTEGSSGFDGLELLRVADQHNFRACIGGMGEHALHLARADHACLIDHQHVARGEHFAALAPLMFKAGDGARGNARTVLQPLGGNAGQRRTANGIARALPCLARNAQHRALAGPGIADNDAEAAPIGHMLERRALLAG
jgi:hypothetical protein